MNDHRLAYHIDSWIALLLIVLAAVLAIGLNHRQAKLRTMATALAALSCVAYLGWYVSVLGTSAFTDPRTLFPTDALKPNILAVQAALVLITGVFLIRVTAWQNQRSDELALGAGNTPEGFGRLSRLLHWTTAILILMLIPMGVFTSMIPEDQEWRQGYYVVHKTLGLTALFLVVLRIGWNFASKRPALDGGLKKSERWMAKFVHGVLYVMMLAFPITGFVMSTYGGKLSHFFIWDLPLWWSQDLEAIKPWGLLHKLVLPFLFYAIFAAHVLGALKHHFIDKHRDSIHRMVS
ncbi:MAG: cytochrome b [Pseudomonadota bacterium]